ncbi:hypothetical protein [Oceanirhabdus seepicola]|uniref:Uncharacterized protein n=1 Tax=Oceanirhabdus seepicola TaxID=2828781 RepID=A0A9J6P553_9CLOT|nr:hypothetical protein [Oceanirhabdus seepicola]MCM1991278.1 hypothetical protein [Oceanirhabdus seepicola]
MIPGIPLLYTGGKYYRSDLKEAVKLGKASVIEINQKGNIDGNIFIIRRIINDENYCYIRYSIKTRSRTWNFPVDVFKIYDDKGNEYRSRHGLMRGTLWSNEGIMRIPKLNDNDETLRFNFELYDRKENIKVNLKRGQVNEL